MTWVPRIAPVGCTGTNSSFDVYYRTRDKKVLRWYGGRTEEEARAVAIKTLADDRKQTLYRFKSAVIVETVITSAVTRHIELLP